MDAKEAANLRVPALVGDEKAMTTEQVFIFDVIVTPRTPIHAHGTLFIDEWKKAEDIRLWYL